MISMSNSLDQIDEFERQLKNPLDPVLLGGINPEKIVRCFSLFSRFEHAMKCHDYAHASRTGYIEPDWKKLCKNMSGAFSSLNSKKLVNSVQYLLVNAPKKQTIHHRWIANPDPNWCRDDSSKAIWRARNVRNNLFHGGKFLDVDKQRDEQLIDAACDILLAVLIIDNTLRQWFEIPPN